MPAATACCSAVRLHGRAEYGLLRDDSGWGISGKQTVSAAASVMVYQEIFCRWLSKTGNELDERPIIDIYRKIEESGYMEIDICFPLKTK